MLSQQPADFREFELSGWRRVASQYHDYFSRLTSQAVEPMLNAVLPPGDCARLRLLDMATGPGYVAGAASSRGIGAVGVDFSEPMAALARSRYPPVQFTVGDAEQLPFRN